MSLKENIIGLVSVKKLNQELADMVELLNISKPESVQTVEGGYKHVFTLQNENKEALVSRFYLLNHIISQKDPKNPNRPNLQNQLSMLLKVLKSQQSSVTNKQHPKYTFQRINNFLWNFASFELNNFTTEGKAALTLKNILKRPQALYLPNDFYPEHVKCIYQHIATVFEIPMERLKVCDPNAKFGEQLLAAASSNVDKYLGFNASTEMNDSYREMLTNHYPAFLPKMRIRREKMAYPSQADRDNYSSANNNQFDLLFASMVDETHHSPAQLKDLLTKWIIFLRVGGYVALYHKPPPRGDVEIGSALNCLLSDQPNWSQLLPDDLRYCHKVGVTTLNRLVTPVFILQRVAPVISGADVSISPRFSTHAEKKNADLKKRKLEIADAEREAKRLNTATGSFSALFPSQQTTNLRPAVIALHNGQVSALQFLSTVEKEFVAGRMANIHDMLQHSVVLIHTSIQSNRPLNPQFILQFILAHFALLGQLIANHQAESHGTLIQLMNAHALSPLHLNELIPRVTSSTASNSNNNSNKNRNNNNISTNMDVYVHYRSALTFLSHGLASAEVATLHAVTRTSIVLHAHKLLSDAENVLCSGNIDSALLSANQQWLWQFRAEILTRLKHTIGHIERYLAVLAKGNNRKDIRLYLQHLNDTLHTFTRNEQLHLPSVLFSEEAQHLVRHGLMRYPALFKLSFASDSVAYFSYQLVEYLGTVLSYQVTACCLQPSGDGDSLKHVLVLTKQQSTSAQQISSSTATISNTSANHYCLTHAGLKPEVTHAGTVVAVLPQIVIQSSPGQPIAVYGGMHCTEHNLDIACFDSVFQFTVSSSTEHDEDDNAGGYNSTALLAEARSKLSILNCELVNSLESVTKWKACTLSPAQQNQFTTRCIRKLNICVPATEFDQFVFDTLSAESALDVRDSFWAVFVRLQEQLVDQKKCVGDLKLSEVQNKLSKRRQLMKCACEFFSALTRDGDIQQSSQQDDTLDTSIQSACDFSATVDNLPSGVLSIDLPADSELFDAFNTQSQSCSSQTSPSGSVNSESTLDLSQYLSQESPLLITADPVLNDNDNNMCGGVEATGLCGYINDKLLDSGTSGDTLDDCDYDIIYVSDGSSDDESDDEGGDAAKDNVSTQPHNDSDSGGSSSSSDDDNGEDEANEVQDNVSALVEEEVRSRTMGQTEDELPSLQSVLRVSHGCNQQSEATGIARELETTLSTVDISAVGQKRSDYHASTFISEDIERSQLDSEQQHSSTASSQKKPRFVIDLT